MPQAVGMELQHMREHKHVFKRHKPSSTGVMLGQAKAAAAPRAVDGPAGKLKQPAAAGVKDKGLLSFGDEEEEEG